MPHEVVDHTQLLATYDTPRVARAINVQAATLLGWRQRHSLFGGSGEDRQARHQYCFIDVCVAGLIGEPPVQGGVEVSARLRDRRTGHRLGDTRAILTGSAHDA
jgi:hypothetical protein